MITIESTYCGPPSSAHGGVAVGRFAALLDGGPTEVRLMAPPPLEVALTVDRGADGTVTVVGPDGDVARVRRLDAPLDVALFEPVGEAEIEEASAVALETLAEEGHPFPTCFGCGPDRTDPEALRQFTGLTADGDTVARFGVEREGPVPDWLVVAGLDCPSGLTGPLVVKDRGLDAPAAIVLGSMQVELHGSAHGGVPYQVRGRLVGVEGRKFTTEAAILSPEGTTIASGRAVWIAVDPAAFKGVTGAAS